MPQQTYEITAPNGKVLEITGDRPPNEGEIRSIFAKAGVDVRPPQSKEPGLATIGDQLKSKNPTWGEQVGGKTGTAVDLAVGAAKGVGNTLFGMGKIVHDYTPVGRISDAIQPGAFEQRPDYATPANTTQRVGYTGEQVGEFFIPMSALSKAGKVGQVAKSVAMTQAQTDSPIASGVSGALTAVIPGGGAAARASSAMRESANKTVAQALGATKEWAKAEATELAPQMLKRGVGGSRTVMLEEAKTAAKAVGQQLDDAYKSAAAAGEVVQGQVIRGALQLTQDALKVKNAKGALTIIPGTERVIAKLGQLDDFVKTLGPNIPVDRAAQVKRVMDKIVDKAGLFGQKATASATDSADAWAFREASGAFRELLNRNPTIAALNGEAAFWTGLKGVLKETQKRTQAQSAGITAAGMGGSGAIIGAMTGDTASEKALNAVLGGLAGRQMIKVLQSPAFRTQAAAPFKNLLADALASGSTGKALDAMKKILESAPAQVTAAAQ